MDYSVDVPSMVTIQETVWLSNLFTLCRDLPFCAVSEGLKLKPLKLRMQTLLTIDQKRRWLAFAKIHKKLVHSGLDMRASQ